MDELENVLRSKTLQTAKCKKQFEFLSMRVSQKRLGDFKVIISALWAGLTRFFGGRGLIRGSCNTEFKLGGRPVAAEARPPPAFPRCDRPSWTDRCASILDKKT